MEDADRLRAWSEGNAKAGHELFERHYRSVYRFFVNKVPGPAEVEDLAQKTFMACVEAKDRYRGEAAFRTFLFAIARNVLLKHLRDEGRRSIDPASTSVADCGMGVSTAVGQRREHQILLAALRKIPIDSQVVLEMVYWEEMTGKEIAAVLDETEPAIRGRLRKAKLELRGAIEAIARQPSELQSTLHGLERWAEGLRGYWGSA